MNSLIITVFIVLLAISISTAAAQSTQKGNTGLNAFDYDHNWTVSSNTDLSLIEVKPGFILAPKDKENLGKWRWELEAYRRSIREGRPIAAAVMAYDGQRSWARLKSDVTRLYNLKAGDKLHVKITAKHLEGNNEIGLAFDQVDSSDMWRGWSGILGTVQVPKDGQWHDLQINVVVPEWDTVNRLKPIIGMDAVHNPERSKMLVSALRIELDDPERMQVVERELVKLAAQRPLDRSIYNRKDMDWLRKSFTCHFTFMYDSSFYDHTTGEYKLESFFKDSQEFDGYDILLLWQGYPRLGVDERNQFDMYRDMPGGLPGIRKVVAEAHKRGIKVFIDYNPWDTGTRREDSSDYDSLVNLVKAIDCDGVFLDTMVGTSVEFRNKMDAAKSGVVFAPEAYPATDQLSICPSSWGQYPYAFNAREDLPEGITPPDLLHHKWIEPRHMIHQINRWATSHWNEIQTAFFNGSGMIVWENIFGTYNPWRKEDRKTWRKCSNILRAYAEVFNSDNCEPYYPTEIEGVYANRWTQGKHTIYTIINRTGKPIKNQAILKALPGKVYSNWWDYKSRVSQRDGKVWGLIDEIGCIYERDKDAVMDYTDLERLPLVLENEFEPIEDNRNFAKSLVNPQPVKKTPTASASNPPRGMVFVPGAKLTMKLEHVRRECGCYPDPGTPPEKLDYFLKGQDFLGKIEHNIGPIKVSPFFIDETEVTNAQFAEFLDATGYEPKHPENFLKHWKNGKMPAELANYPVVYVDLDDARAYAKWAGKRLPTEEEWHLAAQGTDGRKWPWGNDFDKAKCNTTGKLMPVKLYAEGRSPYGCYNMSGNVWEWTESVRDDGHTRFVIIRGGSYLNVTGSIWYIEGGPQPCTSHTKFILMYPGLDRCSTVGFRCVKDVREN